MSRFREKMNRFLVGRYGMDELSRAISYFCIVILALNLFLDNRFIYYTALLCIIFTYFRIFSRNISKRHTENDAYLKLHYKVIKMFNDFKFRIKDRKTHKIFRCPSCSQKIRVPKGKGKISIKCPKCRIEFIKKT